MYIIYERTLNDPRSFTLQANLTFRPAGTVIFPISSTNSGSMTAVTEIKYIQYTYSYVHK